MFKKISEDDEQVNVSHDTHDEENKSIIDRFLRLKKGKSNPSESSPDKNREASLPPLGAVNLRGYNQNTRHKLMNDEIAGEIRKHLPERIQLFEEWELVYSIEQHGVSLNTLYYNSNPRNQLKRINGDVKQTGYADRVVNSFFSEPDITKKRPNGYILIIKDEHHSIFGAYLNEELKPIDQKRYYGNGQCFLWKSIREKSKDSEGNLLPRKEQAVDFKAFKYNGINDNIIYSNNDFIAIGSSHGRNGLWIDRSLYNGISYPCETFGNEVLSESGPDSKVGKFKIVGLEVWRLGELSSY